MKPNALMRLARVVVRGRIARDDDHRCSIGSCGCDACQRVRQTWRKMNVDDRQTMRDAVIGVGGVRRLLLVSKRHVLDSKSMARVDQRIIRMAALTKHLGNTFLLKAF